MIPIMTVAVVLYSGLCPAIDNTIVRFFFNFSGVTDMVLFSVSIWIPKQVTELDRGTNILVLISRKFFKSCKNSRSPTVY